MLESLFKVGHSPFKKVCFIFFNNEGPFEKCITKPCTHLHPAPSTSTQLISTPTQLHTLPSSSFQPPSSSLQHPQQYLNQNVPRNWTISPNLDQKIKSFPFWLKIGTHGILEVLSLNADFDFWNSHPKIHFWVNLGPKFKVVHFVWKLVHLVSQGSWFLIET